MLRMINAVSGVRLVTVNMARTDVVKFVSD